jgi:hypothetical protein
MGHACMHACSDLPTPLAPPPGPQERQHVVFPTVTPRLQAYPDEVKALLTPVHERLAASFHRLDSAGTGYLDMEDVRKVRRESPPLPINPHSH